MRLTINDNELEVETFGDADAPVLIAHHGAPGLGSRAEPRATFAPFADTFRVIVFDARGSGVSEGNGPFTHEQWVADVDALRAWAGVETFVMAGGSYGGFISMEYAIRHPERVRALVLRDTSADHENEKAAEQNALSSTRVTIDRAKLDRINSGTVRDDADLRDCWREILPLYDHVYDPAAVEAKVEATYYRYATHNFAFAVNQPNYDIKAQLSRITSPTLVTVGRSDWITPVASSQTIVDLIPDSRLVVFENSGHSPQIEEADLWRATVREFLSEVGADRPAKA
ncbi:proline iminopeptidase [Hamadaea flava]|uniref:Alpha/beta fold hydrolase n=1 Tax=Hamadaea flava TaxID=1742688 RepID=A0ABV8LMR8_9ACTN|nr:alpha/beta hydrolase [Hamadaea flava]MCP2323183.1 proline iminopeptidase [Hamadaea flava]